MSAPVITGGFAMRRTPFPTYWNLVQSTAGLVKPTPDQKPQPFGVVLRASALPECLAEKRGSESSGRSLSPSSTPLLDRSFMLRATRPYSTIRMLSGTIVRIPHRSDLSLRQIMLNNQQSRNEMLSRMILTTQSLRQLSFTSGPEQVQCRLLCSVFSTEGIF